MPRLRPAAEMDLEDMVSISTESRNETASDIPGPGRLLGEVYGKLGRKLQTVLNFAARSTGRWPAPRANEIERLARTLEYKKLCHMYYQCPPCPKVVVKKLEKKLEKGCKALVKYTRCVWCIVRTGHD